MSAFAQQSIPGGRRSKREVIDVPEDKREDKSLDRLIVVRKQRIDRFERERNEARQAWRAARAELRATKQRWRDGVKEANEYWKEARAGFLSMTTTSGQFRRAKAVYERLKAHAAQLHLQAREAVAPCRSTREGFFQARRRVVEANRQQEKLVFLRDEVRQQQVQENY